ncbi:MAG: hypothetical protein MUC48_22930 [Leptolyngbya sp. Prado105]|nr:hypothetical protein [Leptolyngbya sp. Prado105]
MFNNFSLNSASISDSAVRLSLFVLIAIASPIYLYSQKAAKSIRIILGGYAIAQILFIVFLWFNHIDFPLNLEAMELLRVQHLQRLMQGLPIYPEPSSDFVALAYNPLSYLFTMSFAIVFGANLFTIRLVAMLGAAGSGIVVFLAVRRQTQSNGWGLIAVGLFAAAYRVMDTYLDNAHAESLLLLSILLGCYLIDRSRSWIVERLAMLMFVAVLWFKQQGAIFAIATGMLALFLAIEKRKAELRKSTQQTRSVLQ